jgi:hypothetical protein
MHWDPEAAILRLLTEIKLSPEEYDRARTRVPRIVAALRPKFHPHLPPDSREDHLVVGSFGKRLAIRPAPPLDLLYVIPDKAGGTDRADLIANILTAMQRGLAEPSRHTPLAELLLRAEENWVLCAQPFGFIRILPAFARDGGFAVPWTSGWMWMSPAAEQAALRTADASTQGRLADLIALLKAWRSQTGAALPSISIELLARDFALEGLEGPWREILPRFFVWARRATPGSFFPPGARERILIGDEWHKAAEASHWRIVLAGRHLASGETVEAAQQWQKVLGPFVAGPHAPAADWIIAADVG